MNNIELQQKSILNFLVSFHNHIKSITIIGYEDKVDGCIYLHFDISIPQFYKMIWGKWTGISEIAYLEYDRRLRKLVDRYSKINHDRLFYIKCLDFTEFYYLSKYIYQRIYDLFDRYYETKIDIKIEHGFNDFRDKIKNGLDIYRDHEEMNILNLCLELEKHNIKLGEVNNYSMRHRPDSTNKFISDLKLFLSRFESKFETFIDSCNNSYERAIIGKIKNGTSLTNSEITKHKYLIDTYKEIDKIMKFVSPSSVLIE